MKKEAQTKKVRKGINWKVLIASIIIVYFVAFVGSIFTSAGVKSSWYQEIKPSITPPNWVFPVVWSILFFLIALSLYFSWIKAGNKKLLASLFLLNFDLNMVWSLLYFLLKNPVSAFYCIIILAFSTALTMLYVMKIDRKAFLLLLPYLLWIVFASVLNYLSAFQIFA